MYQVPRHKVFTSFHSKDQAYRDLLVQMMSEDIVDKSVGDGDIDDRNMKTTTIRQKIRDNFVADASVTIVLIGPDTHTRKHVDWEISSSLRKTKKNSRCGMLGILLPNHPDYGRLRIGPPTQLPPRLADNIKGDDPYARVYKWPSDNDLAVIRKWVHTAFQRRNGTPPNNRLKPFAHNRKSLEPDRVIREPYRLRDDMRLRAPGLR